MALFNSRLRLRSGIIINLIALAYIVLSFTGNTFNRTKIGLIITVVFALLVLLYTYYYSFSQTGLWRDTHTIIPGIFDRKSQDSIRALIFAYSVFTIIVLVLLLYYSIGKRLPHIITVAGLIYLAHILPAVYLGWRR